MNLSYPTLRNRLNELIWALGFEPGREDVKPKLTAEDRKAILDRLDQGEISFDDAQKLLKGEAIEESA